LLKELEAIKDKLLQPISESEPCGDDPKYEDSYDALKQEIAKLGGMGAGSTDWNKVELDSINLLETKSKELNLAVYLVSAWSVNKKLAGITVGFELIAGMMTQWWATMYPPLKRIKPRRNAFVWLQDRISSELPKCKEADAILLTRAQEALASMKDAVYEHFEDPPCNFRKIRDTLAEWLVQAEPVASEPEPEPVETAQPTPVQSSTVQSTAPTPPPVQPTQAAAQPRKPTEPVDVPSLADDANAEQLLEVLAKIAVQLRPLAPQATAPYQLLRIALWEGAGEPGSNDSRETFFPAPAETIADAMKTMASRGSWSDLLERAEDLTNRWWYWLDLQRYAAQSAAGLGWDDLATFLEQGAHALDQRLPNLKELKFNDGTPFASPETKDWLTQLERKVGGGGGSVEEDPLDTLLSAMRQLGGDAFGEALEKAQASIASAKDKRTALQFRLAAASFCMEVDQAEWAHSLLAVMVDEMEKNNLAWWEPQLAARVWKLMLESARVLKEESPDYQSWEQRAMHALAAFDLTQVGRFPKKQEPFG